ncbi:MAG: hypothetical protein ACREOE_15715 [Gemmatimonadales bacterium]
MDEHGDATVGGQRLDWEGLPVKTFPRGRHCAEPGCVTVLSVYNDGRYCSQHGADHPVRVRHRKAG